MSKRSKMLILASLSAISIMAGGLHRVCDWNPLEIPPDKTMKVFYGKRTKPKKKKVKYKRKGGRIK